MIRGIAFDWGGIFTEGTFDSDAVRNLTKVAGVGADSVERVYFPLLEQFEAGAFDLAGFVERFTAQTGSQADAELLADTFLASGIERSEMFGILASIPDRYRVGMLSNNVQALCDRVRNDPRMGRIEQFVFSNEIGVRKPAAEAFAALTAAMELPAEQLVFIDDNAANAEAARELGFSTILLDDMAGFRRQWQELLPELPLGETGA